jgi:hypothetical protein
MQMVQSPDAVTGRNTTLWQERHVSTGTFHSCAIPDNCGASIHHFSIFAPENGPEYSLQNTTAWCGPTRLTAQPAVHSAEEQEGTGAAFPNTRTTLDGSSSSGVGGAGKSPPRKRKWLVPLIASITTSALRVCHPCALRL